MPPSDLQPPTDPQAGAAPPAVIVIPARFPSVRFPGKPLVALRGATGTAKSLVQRSWEAACRVPGIEAVWIATDDARIRDAAEGFGAQVVMTSSDCRNGTERVAEAAQALGLGAGAVVINLQGDAPLTPPWFVTALVAAMRPGVQMATPVLRCTRATLAHFLDDRRAGRVGATTAVFDRTGRALYFSKEVLPYTGALAAAGPEEGAAKGFDAGSALVPVFHHVGVYAYRPAALAAYAALPPGPLEALEGLEQLRFLENGWPVQCVEVEARGRAFWEVNTEEDVARVEALLAAEGIA